nr:hypothetical protein [uncultured Lachnoanaerobaculum sp.]
MNTFEQLFMNRNDDNSITYIAYKGAILLVLLILIFNADKIAPRIFLYNYADNNYSDSAFMPAYITTQIILSLLSVLDIGLIVVDYLKLKK